jgi:hypothetical protein
LTKLKVACQEMLNSDLEGKQSVRVESLGNKLGTREAHNGVNILRDERESDDRYPQHVDGRI